MYKKIRLLGVLGCCGFFQAQAQNENSPYSRYGLGDIIPSQNILSRGMGGLGAAYYDYNSINFLNPASYGRLSVTTFDFGIELDSRTIRAINPPRKFNGISPILSYIQLGVPLKKNKPGWGLVFGLRPMTRINYKIQRDERLTNIDSVSTLFEGTGGSQQVYAGTGFKIKNLTLGINIGYLFGSKNYSSRRSFINDSVLYYKSNHETKSNYHGFVVNAGLQYTLNVNKNTILRFGAYGNLGHDVNASQDLIRQTFDYTSTGTVQIDSVFEQKNVSGKVKLPSSYGLGFILDRKKWIGGIEWVNTKWSQYRFFGEKDLVQDSWEIKAGGQIQPAPGKNYWSYVGYRVGFSYGKDYVNAGGQLPRWSFSIGFGLPMRKAAYTNQFSIINTAFEFGQRGNNNNPVRENFFRLSLGLSLSDIWFLKQQYE